MVRLSDGEKVLTAAYLESGMPWIYCIYPIYKPDEVYLTDSTHIKPLEMLYILCGHLSKSKLLVGHRHMFFTGIELSWKHLSKKFVKSVSRNSVRQCE